MDMVSTRVPFSIESEYYLKNFEHSCDKRVFLLMHGYLQSGIIIDTLFEGLDKNKGIYLVPNAPFFVPYGQKSRQYFGYSWYFYDAKNDKYLIDYQSSLEYLQNLLKKLELINNPLTVIGYSQGGYAGLQVAKTMPNCDQLICVNAKARFKYVQEPIDCKIDLINGADDDVIPISGVREDFERIKSIGQNIVLHEVPGCGHKMQKEIINIVNTLI